MNAQNRHSVELKPGWEVVPPEELRPVLGPPCGVGPTGHQWRLTIEEGQVTLWTGCEECDAAVIEPVGGDDVWMEAEIRGRLEFVPDCSNLGGWHGLTRCDCGWSWRFVPTSIDQSPAAAPPAAADGGEDDS